MTKDKVTKQESCSNEHLLKLMKNFLDDMMASAIELHECFETLGCNSDNEKEV